MCILKHAHRKIPAKKLQVVITLEPEIIRDLMKEYLIMRIQTQYYKE